MYRKPRIFISSLLAGKLKIRSELETLFNSVGAEALLYESNLTPSTQKYTYRNDILESDFVIIILDENYGNKTDSGMSGTEEEYRLALKYNLKTHVYIRKTKKGSKTSKDAKKLIDEIKKAGVSYYHYTSDKELIKRIKETVTDITQIVALNSISTKTVPYEKCMKIASDYDYQNAIPFIAVYYRLMEANEVFGHLEFCLMISFMEPMYEYLIKHERLFIDTKYYDLLKTSLEIANEYNMRMSKDFTGGYTQRTISVPYLGEVIISNNTKHYSQSVDRDWYYLKWKEFTNQFEEFIGYVKDRKIETDARYLDA